MKDWLWHLGTWLSLVLTNKVVLLTLGGAAGTNARYWLGRWCDEIAWARGFPLGTFIINVSGSFILGLAATVILERWTPAAQHWYLLVGTGFCGGYTTFSAFSLETFTLLQTGRPLAASANVALSLMLCLAAIWIGYQAAAKLNT